MFNHDTDDARRRAEHEAWLEYIRRCLKKYPMAPGLIAIMNG